METNSTNTCMSCINPCYCKDSLIKPPATSSVPVCKKSQGVATRLISGVTTAFFTSLERCYCLHINTKDDCDDSTLPLQDGSTDAGVEKKRDGVIENNHNYLHDYEIPPPPSTKHPFFPSLPPYMVARRGCKRVLDWGEGEVEVSTSSRSGNVSSIRWCWWKADSKVGYDLVVEDGGSERHQQQLEVAADDGGLPHY
ncbi:Hordoindoline-B1 like [Actinidia chinensis var. chinensis]|uniref:Hordoindoline-B1 like n=1 Tax=Actinidia chinensis var. chinensis TaxID=1590841 RepID=A0A2R6S145_ACTCC|nr:Hordoindoline-B1 like [Actinidia chinensis var. chinensis]